MKYFAIGYQGYQQPGYQQGGQNPYGSWPATTSQGQGPPPAGQPAPGQPHSGQPPYSGGYGQPPSGSSQYSAPPSGAPHPTSPQSGAPPRHYGDYSMSLYISHIHMFVFYKILKSQLINEDCNQMYFTWKLMYFTEIAINNDLFLSSCQLL